MIDFLVNKNMLLKIQIFLLRLLKNCPFIEYIINDLLNRF